MQYIIAFLDGVTAFLSPDLLPLMMVYALWCLGGELRDNRKSLISGFGFAVGFLAAMALAVLAEASGWICSMAVLALGLLRGSGMDQKLPDILLSSLLGGAISLYWVGKNGFFPERLTAEGILLLGCFGLGVTVPFLFAGVFLDRLKQVRPWLREHRKITGRLSGIGLLTAGIIMWI